MPQDPKTMRAVRAVVASPPPVVTLHPQSAIVAAGDAASFSASASDADSVQWQLSTDDGASFSDIPAATATTYTTPALATTDDGNQYRAVFTNASGTATSNVATLTIQVLSYMWIAENFTPVYHWSN